MNSVLLIDIPLLFRYSLPVLMDGWMTTPLRPAVAGLRGEESPNTRFIAR